VTLAPAIVRAGCRETSIYATLHARARVDRMTAARTRAGTGPSAAAEPLVAPLTSEAQLASLMAAAQDGNAAAYQSLLRGCLPLIGSMVRGKGVPADRVEDVIQDVLVTLHRVRHTYDPARPFTPWLRAIAQRRAIDVLRAHGRHRTREIHAPVMYETHPDPAPTAAQRLEQSDGADELRAAVAALPEGQRQAVEELSLRERTLEEAAARTGRTKGALKVNLHRALKTLRIHLAKGDGADA
jgi:RNA polymerase sigma factor (sigma-70 family)